MTPDEQIALWVKGESVHNDEAGECCPDFSCCNPKMQDTPQRDKERFQKAKQEGDEKMVGRLLYSWLGLAISRSDSPVKGYLAGDPDADSLRGEDVGRMRWPGDPERDER